MNKVKIRVEKDNCNFINYLVDNNIYYYDLECIKNGYYLILKYDDYRKISKRFKTTIIKYYGKKGLVLFIDFHKHMILSFMFSLFILYLLSNTIFKIKVNSDNKEITNIIIDNLKKEGISKYKKKKSFDELSDIKKRILSNNKDKLEWIEIIENGSGYIIEVTPRIIIDKKSSKIKESSIYAKKSGLIKRIIVYRGSKIREINEYVKKGDLLISGNVLKDDKVMFKVKSKGIVYAEVWYKAKVSIPFEIVKKEYTGKIINHYYLDINGFKFTIMGKYENDNTINSDKIILKKPYLIFDIHKETKKIYQNRKYKYTIDEAYDLALNTSERVIKERLNSDEYIISKNVLKKEVKRSKMYVEVFYKVFESIGYTSNIDKIGEKDGFSN